MMNHMKKIIASLLAILLTLSFAACGAEEAPVETGNQQLQASQNTTPSTEADSTESTGDVSVPTQTEPDTTQPTATEPTGTEPVVTQPVVTEPVAAEPPATEVPVTEPAVTEPIVTEPVTTEPPATQAPSTEPPATQAPAADPNNYFFNENNNGIDVNAVAIKPRYVYWENGKLVAECFVINGFPHTVANINVKALEIYNASGLIASAAFGELQGLVLPSGYHGVWKFVFNADCVSQVNAALQSLTLRYNVSNTY